MALNDWRRYSISKGAQPFKKAFKDACIKCKDAKLELEKHVSRLTVGDSYREDFFMSNDEIQEMMQGKFTDKLPNDFLVEQSKVGGSIRLKDLNLHHYKKESDESKKLLEILS